MAAGVHAQIPSQNGSLDQTETPSDLDCGDPLLASSAQCTGQSQQYTINPQSPQQYPSSIQQQYGAGAQNLRNNYTDIESLTQQGYGRNQTVPSLLPPEPLTEFQKFVASTTGQVLPIYGANLFRRVPSTFAPIETAPVPSDYVIGPGDELRLRIWGQLNFTANVRVDRSGDVYLPQVGPVHVAGMQYSSLEEHLRGAIQRVYHNFELTVDVGQIRTIQVYVAGEARRPGVYTVSSLSTLVDALFASGGPSLQGSLRHIQLRRGDATITDFDLYDLLVRGDKSKDVKLLPGDVIFIPPVGPQVAATGSVRMPGIYELKEKEPLADLIAAAGGVSAVAAEARVSIERIENHHGREAMEVAYDESGLSTTLADGDLIRVYSIVPSYQKTVILRGNIANPGRFAWHAGMHLSELIPDKESLVTRNYWWKRTQLGLPGPEFEPLENLDRMNQPVDGRTVTINPSTGSFNGPAGSNAATGLTTPAGAYPTAEGTTIDGQMLDETGLQNEADLQQDQFAAQQDLSGVAQNQGLAAQQRGGNTPLAAAQTLSSTQIPRPLQRTDVRLLAPEIDWDYAVIDRQDPNTLKTTLIPFDLGKLVLQHDSSQDLELQPGDVVSVFSEADIRVPIADQTKLIRLSGEFVHGGVYSAHPGETLRQLVERAGGLTPNAYLYGSQFTRESTRAIQQAGIDQYLQTLNLQIQRSSLALAGSPVSSAQTIANGAAAQSSARELLAQLRQIRATGRIVLQFKPDSNGLNAIPDIPLENGDTFIVPSTPNSINVIGAVYNQNSFLYAQGRRLGTYLVMAGGPNADADKKHEFIMRADGEVVSRERENGLWGNEFDSLRINPGDTIVVPERSIRPSALRGVIDWSQMFSQFALGAAALSIIQ
jgi:protein involved in polysaccharide export with SLBB domain